MQSSSSTNDGCAITAFALMIVINVAWVAALLYLVLSLAGWIGRQ